MKDSLRDRSKPRSRQMNRNPQPLFQPKQHDLPSINLQPMKTQIQLPILLLLLLQIACKQEVTDPLSTTYSPERSLKEAADFPVGLATQTWMLDMPQYSEILDTEFNSLTAEYEMKQNITHAGDGSYDWSATDQLLAYARDRDIRVHGHALLWHQAIAPWLEQFQGTDEAFADHVRTYIQEAVRRHADDVTSWDVVNEAFDDKGIWRNSLFLQRMGEDYVAQCFQWANEADSSVLLFYNDYGMIWDEDKLNAMLAMIDDFRNRGIAIHGVGLQMHIAYNWPNISHIQRAVDALVERDLLIHFSEVDIRVNPNGNRDHFTEKMAIDQQQRVEEIVHLYQSIPAHLQFGITFWGLRDTDSWLLGFWGNPDWPLLFDEQYRYKLAHKGFVEAL